MVKAEGVLSAKPRGICFWLVIALCVVLGFVQCWFTRLFYQRLGRDQHNIILLKHRGPLVWLLLIATAGHVLFRGVSLLLEAFVPGSTKTTNPLFYVKLCIYKSVLHAVAYVFVLRAWDLFTSLQSQRAAVKMQWMHSLRADASNWYLATQHTWGNPRWMVRVLAPFYALTISLLTVSPLISLSLSTAFDYAFLVTPMLAIAVIWWKMPEIEDHYGIRSELKYSLLFTVVCFILFIVVALSFQLYDFKLWYNLASAVSALVACTGICIISTYGVLITAEKQQRRYTRHSQVSKIGFDDMTRVLSDKAGFDTFMAHLQTEFATENLLFLLETMNYKLSFFNEPDPIEDTSEVGFWIEFPRRQKVLEMYYAIEDPLERAQRVWHKYLKNSADLVVNIESNTRTLLTQQFEVGLLEDVSLLFIFDRAAKEILDLMKDSWLRFSISEECKRLAKVQSKRQRSPLMLISLATHSFTETTDAYLD